MFGGTGFALKSYQAEPHVTPYPFSLCLNLTLPAQDTDAFGSPHLGRATISGRRLISEREVDEWLQLYHTGTGRPVGLGKGKLHVRVKYTPEEEV